MTDATVRLFACIVLCLASASALCGATPEGASCIRRVPLKHGMLLDVAIGTPPQPFEMLFDTGSAVTWITGLEVGQSHEPAGGVVEPARRPRYDRRQSSSWRPDQRGWHLPYGVGVLYSGRCMRDHLQVVGASGLLVKDQLMGEATAARGYIGAAMRFDGAIGVGEVSMTSLAHASEDPIETMHRQQLIPAKVFSLHADQYDKQHRQINGTLILGGVDSSYHTGGEIFYVPIVSRWSFQLDYIQLEGCGGGAADHQQQQRKLFGVKSRALLDSSSNVIVAPLHESRVIAELVGDVQMNERYEMYKFDSCETAARKRSLQLVIRAGGRRLELSGSDLVLRFAERDTETCYLAIMPMPVWVGLKGYWDFWLLGTPFLKKYYTVYDYEQRRIGFAPSA